jgi:hypothetical protein
VDAVRSTLAKVRDRIADSRDMDVSAIALQGLQQADAQVEQAASTIASFGASTPAGANLDVVDLSSAILALSSAQTQSSVNLSTLKVADQMQKSVIDMIA